MRPALDSSPDRHSIRRSSVASAQASSGVAGPDVRRKHCNVAQRDVTFPLSEHLVVNKKALWARDAATGFTLVKE